jgi:hypothetical protein
MRHYGAPFILFIAASTNGLAHSYESSAVSYARAFAASTGRVKRFLKEELLVQLQRSPMDGALSLSLSSDVRIDNFIDHIRLSTAHNAAGPQALLARA